MEEEAFGGDIARVLFRNFHVVDAESVQSDHDADSGAEDRIHVHRPESDSFGLGLGCILSGIV